MSSPNSNFIRPRRQSFTRTYFKPVTVTGCPCDDRFILREVFIIVIYCYVNMRLRLPCRTNCIKQSSDATRATTRRDNNQQVTVH